MACFRFFIILALMPSTLSMDVQALLGKAFKGCEEKEVTVKLMEAKTCAESNLPEIIQLMQQKSGDQSKKKDVTSLLKNEFYQTSVIPVVAKKICSKRLNLLNCIEPIINLECLDDLNKIGFQTAYKLIIRPVFKFVCEKIVAKDELRDLISCGLKINTRQAKSQLMKCKPDLSAFKLPEELCRLISSTQQCVHTKIKPLCKENSSEVIANFAQMLQDQINCPDPEAVSISPVARNFSSSLKSNSEQIHVNINRNHHSSSSERIHSAIVTLCLTALMVFASR